jgi:hypothetical protein
MSEQPKALRLAAELEAPVFDRWASRDREVAAEIRRMYASLVAGGFTDEGGELWKPPIGPSAMPLLERLDKQRALIEELVKVLREVDEDFEIEGCAEDGAYRAPVRAAIAKAEAQG